MRWQYIIQYNNKASLLSQHQAVTPAFLTSNLRSERQAFSTWLLLILVLMLMLVLMLLVLLVVLLVVLVLVLVVLVVLVVSVYGCSVWLCEAGRAGRERGRQQPGSLS